MAKIIKLKMLNAIVIDRIVSKLMLPCEDMIYKDIKKKDEKKK